MYNKNNLIKLNIQKKKNIEKKKIFLKCINKINIISQSIIELEKKLFNIEQREYNNVLRSIAEIENIRRRSKLDIEKAYKFSLENFINEILPVIDNLERAIDIANKPDSTLISVIEGVELILKSLIKTVNKFGLNIVQDINVPFNPELHQAITMLETEEYEPNKVITVIQKGYILHGKLIRPAMVVVSKGKEI